MFWLLSNRLGGTSLTKTGRCLCGEDVRKALGSWTDSHASCWCGHLVWDREPNKDRKWHWMKRWMGHRHFLLSYHAALRFPPWFLSSRGWAQAQIWPSASPQGPRGGHRVALAERVAGFKGARHGFLQVTWRAGKAIDQKSVIFSSAPIKWKCLPLL